MFFYAKKNEIEFAHLFLFFLSNSSLPRSKNRARGNFFSIYSPKFVCVDAKIIPMMTIMAKENI